ncbi:2-phosphosulfolactate phosphatase [Candidimonas nitroreducens]|uniref:Probable 2-phosphosulfolactate phosphatase n=1 Tax=Candidimonas nitroreducens TaxID=683354 RepID=A0A225M2V3_9BURK|nr:2-phosphosulfolactate phosphatase [Candidimonas nitroreducens]OWT55648.1 2-phosphosulfolactate phosphatase [Candidimonas nitroreducens]
MQKIHVIARKEDFDAAKAPGKIAVVLDIIFATSTIITALQRGARAVIPAADQAQALELATASRDGRYVLAGEYGAETLSGFQPYNPLAMLDLDLEGRDLIYSTTNGTVALRAASACQRVYAGCLLNASAVARHVAQNSHDQTILLLCSGSRGMYSLEDHYGAGCFVHLLREYAGAEHVALTDAAIAALRLFEQNEAVETLAASRIGRRMAAKSMLPDIQHSAGIDTCPFVAELVDGRVVRA